jgi:hypothetical protein
MVRRAGWTREEPASDGQRPARRELISDAFCRLHRPTRAGQQTSTSTPSTAGAGAGAGADGRPHRASCIAGLWSLAWGSCSDTEPTVAGQRLQLQTAASRLGAANFQPSRTLLAGRQPPCSVICSHLGAVFLGLHSLHSSTRTGKQNPGLGIPSTAGPCCRDSNWSSALAIYLGTVYCVLLCIHCLLNGPIIPQPRGFWNPPQQPGRGSCGQQGEHERQCGTAAALGTGSPSGSVFVLLPSRFGSFRDSCRAVNC